MRKTNYFLLIIFFLLKFSAQSQPNIDFKRDNKWILGSDYLLDVPGIDGAIFDFSTNPVTLTYQSKVFEHYISDASICDTAGNLILYTNGYKIAGANHELIANSDGFNQGNTLTVLGLAVCQGVLFLPLPGSDVEYALLHVEYNYSLDEHLAKVFRLNYTLVDMSKNNGAGEVTLKNQVLINDTLENGMLTACRHANGRDWWILVPELFTNRYYRILLDLTGPHIDGIQEIGGILGTRQTLSQAVFSPDGTRYVRCRSTLFYQPDTIAVYNFDRCSGLLSSPELLIDPTDSSLVGGGVAISPNSRYLYKGIGRLYQYDLQASDIGASKQLVAIPQAHNFFAMQLGPDGKIYICAGGGSPYLHRIDYPDLPGPACGVCEDCVALPYPAQNFGSMPNFPNFRLGPLDGSPCDTLGIDVMSKEPADGDKSDAFSTYPNPFHDIISLSFPVGIATSRTVQVFDILGQVLTQEQLPSTGGVMPLDLGGFANGVYWLIIKEKGKVIFSEKIVKL